MSVRDDNEIVRRKRNILSLVKERKPTDIPDTFRSVENILNENNLRFRDKLTTVKQRITSSTKKWSRYVL